MEWWFLGGTMARTFKGKNSYIPKSDKYSAQNIPDTSTPQGTSAVNEEFRRIDAVLNKKESAVAPVIASSSGGTDSTPQVVDSKHSQRLTVEHNDIPVIALTVENIDFLDSNSIEFEVVTYLPKKVEITARGVESGLYRATRIGQILYSRNGSTFRRELPITSFVSGILLNSDGVILIQG